MNESWVSHKLKMPAAWNRICGNCNIYILCSTSGIYYLYKCLFTPMTVPISISIILCSMFFKAIRIGSSELWMYCHRVGSTLSSEPAIFSLWGGLAFARGEQDGKQNRSMEHAQTNSQRKLKSCVSSLSLFRFTTSVANQQTLLSSMLISLRTKSTFAAFTYR